MFRVHPSFRGEGIRLASPARVTSLALLALTLACHATPAFAQKAPAPEPQLNQPGKDVQWVPTPPALVDKMLDLAQVTSDDRFVDLGSGDGVLVIAAAKRGAKAKGIEYDRGLVELSKRRAAEAGVGDKTRFVRGDIFKTDFSDATVVTTFLLPSMNLRLRPTFLAMKPGTRIVANTFAIGDWEPEQTVTLEDPCERWCKAMLWVVPAHVGGVWLTPRGDLTVTQKFQFFSGTLGRDLIENGRLHGEEISFTAGGVSYQGRVEDGRMRVNAIVDGKPVTWTARPAPASRR
jgi:SAM-dependent methyltransferase